MLSFEYFIVLIFERCNITHVLDFKGCFEYSLVINNRTVLEFDFKMCLKYQNVCVISSMGSSVKVTVLHPTHPQE